ncbi:MAG: hypothetical protein QGG42_16455 [Phycisphaerae bacterium]|nr:hypothetical protein [Phycisphaerae bacterium]
MGTACQEYTPGEEAGSSTYRPVRRGAHGNTSTAGWEVPEILQAFVIEGL